MSRQGRSHRGRRGQKKKTVDEIERQRVKAQRKREEKNIRDGYVKIIEEKVFPICDKSRIGVALPTQSLRVGQRPFRSYLTRGGRVRLRTVYEPTSFPQSLRSDISPRVIGYRKVKTTPWGKIDLRFLKAASEINNWSSLLEKSALEQLAECADYEDIGE